MTSRLLPFVCWGVLASSFSAVNAEERQPTATIDSKTNSNSKITWHKTDKWPTLGPIGFRLTEFPEDTFLLLFPEWITSREMNWHVKPTWKTAANGATAEWKSGEYALRLKLVFQTTKNTRTLEWEYTFTNGSKKTLTDVAAFNCFNMVEAPSFLDLKMERTWVSRKNENPVRLADVMKTRGKRTMQFYPAKGGLKLPEFERFSHYGVTSKQELDGDRIGITSRDGKWSVQSIVNGRVAYFFNNWESDHGCIHAAPTLGTIAPGKTAKVTGSLLFTHRN